MDYVEYPLLDNELDNVLLYVDDCFRQVSRRLGKGERVLIHCVQGVSRSVALVTAFVMRYNFSSFDQAYATVTSRYSDANIADNFKRQLVEYGSVLMWDMSLNTQAHRLFRLKNGMRNPETSPVRAVEEAQYRYLCRKCRVCLFLDVHVIPVPCENYRIECMEWMKMQVESCREGSLNCCGCGAKVGQFNWIGFAGLYEIPGFVITKSKVDQMPLVSSFAGTAFPKTLF